MPADEEDKVLTIDVWRRVAQFSPAATRALLGAALEKKAYAELADAVTAGIPVPEVFAAGGAAFAAALKERLSDVVRLATYGAGPDLEILQQWLERIHQHRSPTSEAPITTALDSALRQWIGASPTGTYPSNPAVLTLLRDYGARLDRAVLNEKGVATSPAAIEQVLEADRVDVLANWYGDQEFNDANPAPTFTASGSRRVSSILAPLLVRSGPLNKCKSWLVERTDPQHKPPLEDAFACGVTALDNAQTSNQKDGAIRAIGRILIAGAIPKPGNKGADAAWRALVKRKGGDPSLRLPLSLIHKHNQAMEALERLLDLGVIDIDDPEDGTLLHHAAITGQTDTLLMLLERGARSDMPFQISEDPEGDWSEYHGLDAAQAAEHAGYSELARLVRAAAARHALISIATKTIEPQRSRST